MANWIISTRVGFGGRPEALDNENSQVGGSREALQASRMSPSEDDDDENGGFEMGWVGPGE